MNRRVLHVSAVDFTTAKLLAPQLRELRSAGFEARVATGKTDEQFWTEISDLDPVDIEFPRTLNPIQMLISTVRLVVFVRKWRPGILHLHTPAASIPIRLVPRWMWPAKMRIVYTVHGYLHMWPPVGRRDRVVQRLEQWLSRRTDVSLFQSREDLEQAIERSYGSKLVYLGNGVEDAWFHVPPPRTKGLGKLNLIFVGRLVREKGVLDLLDAVRTTPGVQLHVVGDALPSDRDSVSSEVRRRVSTNADLTARVHLHGMLSRSEVMHLYSVADAVILPSYREGVPRSLIEGLAAARPAICTRIRGCTELIQADANGQLTEPGNVEDLARAIAKLCDTTAVTFASLSSRARSSADPALRETEVFKRLLQAYQISN